MLCRYIVQNEGMATNDDTNITRVLFCGPYFPPSHIYTKEYLQNYPFIQVDDVPLADVPKCIGNYHLCVVKSMQLNSNVISRAKRMKLIIQYGVGLEGHCQFICPFPINLELFLVVIYMCFFFLNRYLCAFRYTFYNALLILLLLKLITFPYLSLHKGVDIDAATNCGIKVARIPGDVTGNAASCAEMAIYLMLGLLRKQNEMQIAVKQKKLGEPIGETLLGKTVYIMGFGNIGVHLAKRLRPFGVKIIATKRSWASHTDVSSQSNALPVENGIIDDLVDEKGIHEDSHKFASKANIVVCCLILNKETVGIVNRSFISSMKEGSLLVNIARGGILDYEAVAHYLECGHLGGLGIDVAWTEPFNPDDPILKFNNVIITPHVAGVTKHSYRSMAKVVGDVALQLHAGTPLTGIEFVN
ncbi:hypothetical protein Ddye_005521 [Dipteronia dyeriana]|uniref:D-isomer specific 2-hydroxyacid dehydrogenase NAD-binding domain-containing protein n=1 Tax=Dipteronia dyeriana TaxID=168575 RepID=A0AAD9XHA5_9ROSI|nr:hypothetical protein Ddye_005521 [Dipteronia dyeriana]